MYNRFLKIAAVAAASLASPVLLAQEVQDTVPASYDDLDELVIVAKKDVVKSDGATLTYDMSRDASSKGQTLLDALRKVPMVTVDGQDNVYIKGSSNFKVYTNGKDDPMLTANYKTVFKSMPAEAVTKIEVITEPGAKYDAEGTGGILNLITETKQTKDGYAGSATISGSNQQMAAALYGRMRQDKVTADANVTYAQTLGKLESRQHSDMVNPSDLINNRQVNDIEQNFKFRYVNASLNLSWEPSASNLFSAGADVSWTNADCSKMHIVNSMFKHDGSLLWSNVQDGTAKVKNLDASGNVAWRHNFGRQDNYLSMAYRFNFGNSHTGVSYLNSVLEGDMERIPFEKNSTTGYQRQHTANIDYENSIADGKHVFQTGAKAVFRRNSNSNESMFGMSADDMQPAGSGSGYVDQVQDIYALYAAWRGTFGNVGTNAGVRYEHTYMGLDFLDPAYTDFRRNLDDIVPNAAVTYMFGPANNLRLAYQMRIWRPSADQMNPTVFKMTDSYAKVGNPDLESERHNSVSLTYSNFGRVLGGNISASYRQSDNSIESFQYVKDGVTYDTSGNLGTKRSFDLSGFINWNISPKMSVSLSGSVLYTDIKAGKEGLQNYGWTGNYNASWNYTGPWGVNYGIYGGQSTGTVNLQGKFYGWNYYGLSIKKSFLKDDALSVTINANNFFTKYKKYVSKSVMNGYHAKSVNHNRSWNVGISVSWNFGHLSDKVKSANTNQDTDDTKKSEKGSGGGLGL